MQTCSVCGREIAGMEDARKEGGRWFCSPSCLMQGSSGNWTGEYGLPDTCFALLFLKRANVAEDLTLNLRGIIKTRAKKLP